MTIIPKSKLRTGDQNENSGLVNGKIQTRDYIIDMLAELCELAQKNKQDDIWPFLNLSYLAIKNSEHEDNPPLP